MKISFVCLFLWISWLGFRPSLAQQYPILKYTTQEGLGQNQVLAVLKDSRGYVWCGTWYGASKFNGETFENFTQKEGLWNSAVMDIQEDKNGNIWFLSNRAVARFDGRTFKKYQAPYGFTNLIVTKQNKIQVAAEGTLLEVQGDTLLPVAWTKKIKEKSSRYSYHAASDNYLLQSYTHLYSYQRGKLKTIGKGLGDMAQIHGDIHLKKINAPNDIEHYFWNGSTPVPYLKLSPNKIQILKVLPYDFVFTHQDQLYYLPANSDAPESLGKNPPMSGHYQFLNQSASSVLWLPTEKGLWGLVRNGFKHFTTEQVPFAWTVVEQSNGKFLIGNYRVSLQEFDGKKLTDLPKNYVTVSSRYPQQHRLPLTTTDQWYYRALRDQSGACWLPEAEGAFRYADGQLQCVRPAKVKGNLLMFCMAEDKKRKKIVAACDKYFCTIETQAPYRTDSIRGKAPLFDRLIMCNAVAPNGDYWFAGLGVERYDPDTQQFKSYTKDNGKLPTKGIIVLYFDWKGTLWAGGHEMLCRYNAQKDVFEEVLQGQFNKHVQLIEQIDPTHLLVGDMQNLHVIDLQHLHQKGSEVVKTFNHHNGFVGMEPGQLGSYRDSRGRIWITSSTVLSVLDPQQLDLQVRPIQTVITQVNQERVPFAKETELIRLAFGENNVSIKVESLGEDRPYHSQFSFRLNDSDSWSQWQESPLIHLANLPGGTHTLQVRSRLGTLQSNTSSVAKVLFMVSLYFWKSPNFFWYASLIGSFLSVLIAFLWWRDGKKSRNLLAQQRQIEARERQMRLLQAQTIQSQMNPHFTSNALAAIQKLVLTQDTERANNNLIKMSRLTRAYLEDSLFKESSDPNPFTREISLEREVELLQMYVDLMQLQYEGRFEYVIDIKTSLHPANHRLPPFLIQPFVENAIVHGLLHKPDKGTLQIHFWTLADETLVCKVEDNGIGREAAAQLQPDKPHRSVSTSLTQTRLELLNQLGYQIEIKIEDSPKNAGTIVTIQMGYV